MSINNLHHRQLWCPSSKRSHDDHDLNTNQSRLEEEAEFHRIRNLRQLDKILKTTPLSTESSERSDDIQGSSEEEISLVITTPPQHSILDIINSSLVIGQEIALAAILLAIHREIVVFEEIEEKRLNAGALRFQKAGRDYLSQKSSLALMVVYATLLVIVYFNQHSSSSHDWGSESCKRNGPQKRTGNDAKEFANKDQKTNFRSDLEMEKRKKVIVRLFDGLILAAMLRFLSSVLRTLTASYSTDTIYTLAISAMVVHLISCDYKYANGVVVGEDTTKTHFSQNVFETNSHRRPGFMGGTVSLNAAFFSTALLVSRIQSNITSYAFVSSVVTLFAFYPESRHRISRRYPNSLGGTPCLIITVSLSLSAWLLVNPIEKLVFVGLQFFVLVISPCIQWSLQRHKQIISGSWDIAHVKTD